MREPNDDNGIGTRTPVIQTDRLARWENLTEARNKRRNAHTSGVWRTRARSDETTDGWVQGPDGNYWWQGRHTRPVMRVTTEVLDDGASETRLMLGATMSATLSEWRHRESGGTERMTVVAQLDEDSVEREVVYRRTDVEPASGRSYSMSESGNPSAIAGLFSRAAAMYDTSPENLLRTLHGVQSADCVLAHTLPVGYTMFTADL